MRLIDKRLLVIILLAVFIIGFSNYNQITPVTQTVEAHNGNTYSVPFSNQAPLLDGVFDDQVWATATNTTYQINNPLNYRMTGYVADFSVALIGTPSGLYIAFTLTMVVLDQYGMGFTDPGFIAQFDTDHDAAINRTDFAATPDDDLYLFVQNNNTAAGAAQSQWSNRQFEYTMIGDLTGRNLTRTLRAEVRYSYLQSNATTQTYGVNFGIRYFKFGGWSWDQFSFMVDSGDKVTNSIRDPNLYTIGSFANLVLNPGVVVDMYPPTINLLTPVTSVNGVYNLSVYVTDVNTIIDVGFSEDSQTWTSLSEVVNDPGKYTYQWDSSGFTGNTLYFSAMDNQSNYAILTILVSQAQPAGDYEFIAVTIDNSPPLLTVINPTSGSTLSGVITIQVLAIDPASVVMVDWKIGDGNWSNMFYNVLNGYWEVDWDTTTLSDATYTLSFKARDSVNNTLVLQNEISVNIQADGIESTGVTTVTTEITDTTIITANGSETVTVTDTTIVTSIITQSNSTQGNDTSLEDTTDPAALPVSPLPILFGLALIPILKRKFTK